MVLGLEEYSYENFDINHIEEVVQVFRQDHLKGLNVTIPYKEQIIPYLDELDPKAEKIGAINTIKITEKGLKGFNTDAFGFQKSLEPLLRPHHTKALILGTGGASKAVRFVLEELGIEATYVSRNPKKGQFTYTDLNQKILLEHNIIINCTPLGTSPNIEAKPDIPYQFITKNHLLYDLIYNPAKTTFLALGEAQGATSCNGYEMLVLQAEKAWEIWTMS